MNNLYKELAATLLNGGDDQIERTLHNVYVPSILKPLADLLSILDNHQHEHQDKETDAAFELIGTMLQRIWLSFDEEVDEFEAISAKLEIRKADWAIDELQIIKKHIDSVIDVCESLKKTAKEAIDSGKHKEAIEEFQFCMKHGIVKAD